MSDPIPVEGRPMVTELQIGVEVTKVLPGGLGEEAGILSGDVIERINGEAVRDAIDYRFHIGDDLVELEVLRAGHRSVCVTIDESIEAKGVIKYRASREGLEATLACRVHVVHQIAYCVGVYIFSQTTQHSLAPRFAHQEFDFGQAHLCGRRAHAAVLHDAVAVVLPVFKNANRPVTVNHWFLQIQKKGGILNSIGQNASSFNNGF